MPSTATFWSLMERWRVPDDQALELIAYDGKLPDSGKRPRFRLSSTQVEFVSSLVEIDIALLRAGAMQKVPGSMRKMTLEYGH